VSKADPARGQARLNAAMWRRRDLVVAYANRELRPVEVLLLVRHREALSGRVLELGCGAGRLTGYLGQLSPDVLATDVSEAMLAAAARRYPGVRFERLDLAALDGLEPGAFDAVVAGYNLLDILDDAARRRALVQLRERLAPGGLLIFSSHNLAAAGGRRSPWFFVRSRNPARVAVNLALQPRRLRNQRRARRFEVRAPDHAVLNDESHDFGALHYYIAPAAQAAQLAAAGLELVECLDLDGRPVPPGGEAAHSPEIHYVARAAA
jgi:SAM-dependent methyltransferase